MVLQVNDIYCKVIEKPGSGERDLRLCWLLNLIRLWGFYFIAYTSTSEPVVRIIEPFRFEKTFKIVESNC